MEKTGGFRARKHIARAAMYFVLILMAVYTLIPFASILLTSFRTERDAMRGPFLWPKQWDVAGTYAQAWTRGRFDMYLGNSLYMMVLTVLGTLSVSTLSGYSFAKLRYPGRNTLYYTLLFSMMIPFQTIMLPMYFILRGMGLLNSLNGIVLLSVATGLGFGTMMMRSFFVSIPDSMIEAARVDGCSEVQILTRIVLPNTFPAWSSLIVFVAMGSWNNLLAPMLYIFNEAKYPIPYALFAFQGAHKTDYALLSAAMMISILPIVIVYLVFQSRFQADLLGGAVKG